MKLAIIALALLAPSVAFAGGNDNRNHNVAQSYAASNSSINQRDRLQPGATGGISAYCSDGIAIGFPGGSIAASTMTRVCKQEKLLGMANTYYGGAAARQVGCENVKEFRTLPACVRGRNATAAAIQRRDRAKYGR